VNQLALNLEEGSRRKRAGMALAASRNSEWMQSALEDLRVFAAAREEFPMEVYRAYRKLRHMPAPTSPNCWGAFSSTAIKAGIIEPTGRYIKASSVKTRAHPVAVYRNGR